MDEATLLFQRALEDEIAKRTDFNKGLLSEQAALEGQMAGLPAQLRDEFNSSAIRDPFAQERIIAQRKGALGGQAGFLNSLLEGRGQRFSDIIGRATQGVGAVLADRERARVGSGGFDVEGWLEERFGTDTDTTDTAGNDELEIRTKGSNTSNNFSSGNLGRLAKQTGRDFMPVANQALKGLSFVKRNSPNAFGRDRLKSVFGL